MSGLSMGTDRFPSARRIRRLLRRASQAIARGRIEEPLEFEQIMLRFAIGAIISAYLVFSYAFEDLYQRSGSASAVVMGCAWCVALGLLVHLCLRPKHHSLRRTISILNDAVLVSLIIAQGQETAVMVFPVYLWMILCNGFRFGIGYLYAAITANLGCFIVMATVTPYWHDAWPFSIGLGIALLLIPLYVAALIRRLRSAMETAEEASRAKTEFLSMISHELRTPLSAIIGLAHVSKITASSAKERFSAVSTELAASRLLRMLDTILKFQRIESGAGEQHHKPFDLLDILNEVRAIAEPLAEQKGLDFHIRFLSALPPRLESDPDHIQTIILNLVTNAVKYTAEGSVVLEIALVEDAGELILRMTVEDTGSGIAPEAQSRIFERFVRAQEHNASAESGVGLGLATTKSLTELLGGELGFRSMSGVGSFFWIELPVAIAEGESGVVAQGAEECAPVIMIDEALPPEVIGDVDARIMSEAAVLREYRKSGHQLEAAVIVFDPECVSRAFCGAMDSRLTMHGHGPALFLTRKPSVPMTVCLASAIGPERGDMEDVKALLRTVARWHRRISLAVVGDQTPPVMNTRRLSILVADDNALNREVVRRMLELDGHGVVLAETGGEALRSLSEADVDLAFLDVNMPDMSGVEVCVAYGETSDGVAPIPILAVTADISPETRQACLKAGMREVLSKPVTLERLREAVSQYALVNQTCADSVQVASVIDASEADERRLAALRDLFGETGLRAQFLPSFERDLNASLAKLRGAVAGNSPPAVKEALHAIKSSASTAGARQILDEVERLQGTDPMTDPSGFEARIRKAFERYREIVNPGTDETVQGRGHAAKSASGK